MIRVCKPGGFIYIDHEANENRWNTYKNLSRYNAFTKQTNVEHFKKLSKTREIFNKDFWESLLIMLFINKRHKREGDIHVWKDDHIKWEEIKKIVKSENYKIIQEVDYLMYKPKGGIKLYNTYKNLCNDTKYIFIKNIYNFPFINIIMLNYNELRHLRQTIFPILKLDYPNYEFIIVDNGSNNDSLQFIKKFKAKRFLIMYHF